MYSKCSTNCCRQPPFERLTHFRGISCKDSSNTFVREGMEAENACRESDPVEIHSCVELALIVNREAATAVGDAQ